MSGKYHQLLEEYKTRNNGVLPTNLYSKTNAELQALYIELTEDRWSMNNQTFPKEVLVARLTIKISDDEVLCMTHDRHLKPLWKSVGMTTDYPKMTGKELVMGRIKVFAENNLRYHGHIM